LFFSLTGFEQPAILSRFGQDLNPNCILLFTFGTKHGEAWGMNRGENLFHAFLDPELFESLLRKHYFEVFKT